MVAHLRKENRVLNVCFYCVLLVLAVKVYTASRCIVGRYKGNTEQTTTATSFKQHENWVESATLPDM